MSGLVGEGRAGHVVYPGMSQAFDRISCNVPNSVDVWGWIKPEVDGKLAE